MSARTRVELMSTLVRVQCKWARRKGDGVAISPCGSWHSPSRGHVRSSYSPEEVDLIVAYCQELERFYALPVEDFPNQTQIHLRLAPARNGQLAGLHLESEYRLGAVAQLAERFAGSEEARGSNPLSSTPNPDPQIATVGAHGKPFARLLPP